MAAGSFCFGLLLRRKPTTTYIINGGRAPVKKIRWLFQLNVRTVLRVTIVITEHVLFGATLLPAWPYSEDVRALSCCSFAGFLPHLPHHTLPLPITWKTEQTKELFPILDGGSLFHYWFKCNKFPRKAFLILLVYCECKSHSPEQCYYSYAFVDVFIPTSVWLVSSDPRLFCIFVCFSVCSLPSSS